MPRACGTASHKRVSRLQPSWPAGKAVIPETFWDGQSLGKGGLF